MLKIKELRVSKNLSMKQAAEELGMPYTTYINYEKGYREPNLETLKQLAKYFNVSVDSLMREESNDSKVAFYDRFQELCNEKGVSPSGVAIAAGINKGSVSYWKKKYNEGIDAKPDLYTAEKLAKYFDVSVDFLIGREPTNSKATFYDRFQKLCAEKGISCKQAVLEIGLSHSIAAKWKRTGAIPTGDTLELVAKYFNVPTDLLLGMDRDQENSDRHKVSACLSHWDKIRESLQSQLQLISERSKTAENSSDLALLSDAMVKIANALIVLQKEEQSVMLKAGESHE